MVSWWWPRTALLAASQGQKRHQSPFLSVECRKFKPYLDLTEAPQPQCSVFFVIFFSALCARKTAFFFAKKVTFFSTTGSRWSNFFKFLTYLELIRILHKWPGDFFRQIQGWQKLVLYNINFLSLQFLIDSIFKNWVKNIQKLCKNWGKIEQKLS